MTVYLLPKGREGILDGTVDFDTDTIKAALLVASTPDTAVKTVTGATNATPIVITATAHGFADGDIVIIGNVGGNLAANNIWKIKNKATNTFELADLNDGTTNSVGSGAYTSGGYAICLGPSAAGDNYDDFNGAVIGTPQTLASKTVSNGVADAADATFTAVASGSTVDAVLVYEDTGTPSTSRVLLINDGKHRVTCAAAASSSATSVGVEPLTAAIPNGTSLYFSNGAVATLTALASVGDRTLTVSALAAGIAAGKYASAPATSSGLPKATNDGDIVIAWSNAGYGIFAI